MKLTSVTIHNFRCLDGIEIPFQSDLTVLIGENDSGKSSVLDIIEWVLEAPYQRTISGPRYPVDFTSPGKDISIEMTFRRTNNAEGIPAEYVDEQNRVHIRVVFPADENSKPQFEILAQEFQIPEVGLSAKALRRKRKEDLDDILRKLGVDPREFSGKEEKISAILNAQQSIPTIQTWKKVSPNDLKFLPRIQRYRALEYKQPEKFLEKTLKAVAASALYSLRDTNRKLKSVRDLEDRIRRRLSQEVKQLLGFIQRILPEARDIAYDPDIRLEESLRGGELLVDMGYGLHPLSRIGDGTKRRIVMAAMEWEREVLRRIGSTTPLLRAYDEPDTNLHYNAQRVFFRAVRDIVKENPSQQAILCTHSVFMIDAAPARCIVHLSKNTNGKTEVAILPVDKDAEIARFLENVAFQMGVRNSVLFFDRCYLLVEGDTEYYALPILYHALYGHSMAEDGIAIINLGGDKSPAVLFRLLERRARLVLFVLDADVSEARKDELKNQGWSEAQINASIISIGDKEFEDIFSDQVWAEVAEQNWPRRDGQRWTAEMIRRVREGQGSINTGKFSKDLCNVIRRETGIKIGKPEMGQKLAEYLARNRDEIPQVIRDVFKRARQIAGVEET